jgi:4-alpha-glucanotransferase
MGDRSFERIYQASFKPLLAALYAFPDIPIALHYSGILLEWLEKRHPEFCMLLNEMVARKQIEFVGGGYYEPILSLIPPTDRFGQVEFLTTYVRKLFGKRPRGVWLAEKVWENNLAATLKGCGMDYTFLDDAHFMAGGIDRSMIRRPCITEDQGKGIVVFPLVSKAEHMIQAMTPQAAVAKILAGASPSDGVLVVMLDGNELARPELSSRLFAGKWLDTFLNELMKKSDGIEFQLPARYLKGDRPLQKGYFPSFASERIMSCSLSPPNRARYETLLASCKQSLGDEAFVRGGGIRQFFIRYPESALLYSKMQYVHAMVNQLRGDKYRKNAALEELWKGQCGDAYWHGDADGLYANRVRQTAYGALIEAEKISRNKAAFVSSIVPVDFDMDGQKEYLYQGVDMNAYVHSRGGMLFELDYMPAAWNYVDTFSRYPEAYHTEAAGNAGYDRYPRKAFVDHFWSPQTERKAVRAGKEEERGSFADSLYRTIEVNRGRHELVLACDAPVTARGHRCDVSLEKRFNFKKGAVNVAYTVSNRSPNQLDTLFAVEINLSFASGSSEDWKLACLKDGVKAELGNGELSVEKLSELNIEDMKNEVVIRAASETPAGLWSFPVEAYSNVDGTTGKAYQSNCFILRWRLDLAPQAQWSNRLTLQIG